MWGRHLDHSRYFREFVEIAPAPQVGGLFPPTSPSTSVTANLGRARFTRPQRLDEGGPFGVPSPVIVS
jgi:hypothetical protein